MDTTVSARHCEITPDLTERARGVMERVRHYSQHALEAHVVFDDEAGAQRVEVRLHVRGGQILVATATEADHRTALDRAEEKIRRQVEKSTTQALRARRAPSEP